MIPFSELKAAVAKMSPAPWKSYLNAWEENGTTHMLRTDGVGLSPDTTHAIVLLRNNAEELIKLAEQADYWYKVANIRKNCMESLSDEINQLNDLKAKLEYESTELIK